MAIHHHQNDIEEEDQVSMTIDDDCNEEEISDSESECVDSNSAVTDEFGIFTRNGMLRLDEASFEHDMVKMSFISNMGTMAKRDTNVVAIHQNILTSDFTRKARFESFKIFSQAVGLKYGGYPNIQYAWYTGSKDELCEIVLHGFKERASSVSYGGVGVHLIPAKFCSEGAMSSAVDENGLKHMLLCRVILGKTETVARGSRQSHPSSNEVDTGVDDLVNPRRYIVWSASMNTHILPCFVVSFKSPSRQINAPAGFQPIIPGGIRSNKLQTQSDSGPTSPWISFPTLMAILSKFMNRPKMEMLMKCYKELEAKKITRQQGVQRLRRIVGDDKLLAAVIKKYRNKMTGMGIPPNTTNTNPNA